MSSQHDGSDLDVKKLVDESTEGHDNHNAKTSQLNHNSNSPPKNSSNSNGNRSHRFNKHYSHQHSHEIGVFTMDEVDENEQPFSAVDSAIGGLDAAIGVSGASGAVSDGDCDSQPATPKFKRPLGNSAANKYATSLPIMVPNWLPNHSRDEDDHVDVDGDCDLENIERLAESFRACQASSVMNDGTELFGPVPRPRLRTSDFAILRPQ